MRSAINKLGVTCMIFPFHEVIMDLRDGFTGKLTDHMSHEIRKRVLRWFGFVMLLSTLSYDIHLTL